MGYQVVWPAVSVADMRDPKNVKDGIVFQRGAMLPDWVDEFTLHVLSTSGGVKAVETPDPVLKAVTSPPEPVRLQEHAPEFVTNVEGSSQDPTVKDPKDVKGEPTIQVRGVQIASQERQQRQQAERPKNDDPNRPADSASKADWLAYAKSRETDKAKRDALTDDVTRAELINTYG